MPSELGKTALSRKEWEQRLNQQSTAPKQPTSIGTKVSANIAQPVTLSFCHTLRRDQILVVDHLNKGRDVFELVSAGGGKTLPILCWWFTNCVGINVINPQQHRVDIKSLHNVVNYQRMPKLIWCVPTRQLSQRFVTEEFRKPVANLLSSIIMNLIGNIKNNSELIPVLSFLRIPNASTKINEIIQLKNLFDKSNNTVYQQQLDSKLTNLRQDIDDAAFKITNEFITVAMEGVKPNLNAAIIIGIYESIAARIKNINNAKLIVFDEGHKMFPADVKSLDSELEREFNIADAVYEIVKNTDINARIAFLSGTINPATVDQLLTIMNVCFGRKFVVHTSSAKNPAKLDIVKDDNLRDINYLVNLAVNKINRRDWGNLIVLFSKKQIESICRQIDEKLMNANFSPKEDMYAKQSKKQTIADRIMKDPDLSQIQDSLLRQYAAKGFGFITSSVSPNDQAIIGSLFANKKLAVLITTDSVEVGINLSVKNLYIPSLSVFRGNEFRELPMTNLNQLINRAGRSAISHATIYTTSEYYDLIETALILTPQQYEPVPLLMSKKISNIDCRQKLKLYYARMKLDPILQTSKNISSKVFKKIRELLKR